MYSSNEKKFLRNILERGTEIKGYTSVCTKLDKSTKMKIVFNKSNLFYMSWVDAKGNEEIIVEGNQMDICEIYDFVGVYIERKILDMGGT